MVFFDSAYVSGSVTGEATAGVATGIAIILC